MQARPRDFPDAPKTLRTAVNAQTKALLQSLAVTSVLPGFPDLWLRMLRVLQVGPPVHVSAFYNLISLPAPMPSTTHGGSTTPQKPASLSCTCC